MELLPVRLQDIQFALEMRNASRHCFIDNRVISYDEQLIWFDRLKRSPEIDFRIIWINGVRVGTISVTRHSDGSLEIGNGTVRSEYRGHGIATAAETLLADPRVRCWGTYLEDNPAAAIVMKRAGWEPIEIGREAQVLPRSS